MESVRLSSCVVHFPDHYDDRGEWEAEEKGWLQGVEVELPDGSRYPMFLYDPVRLAQDLDARAGGLAMVAEPGMVVLHELTRETVLRSVPELVRQRFFDSIRPLRQPELNGTHAVARTG